MPLVTLDDVAGWFSRTRVQALCDAASVFDRPLGTPDPTTRPLTPAKLRWDRFALLFVPVPLVLALLFFTGTAGRWALGYSCATAPPVVFALRELRRRGKMGCRW